MTHLTMDEAAIVAAAQASEATVELLRFTREGPFSERAAFGDDVVAKLAEALKLAIDIDEKPADQASYRPGRRSASRARP